MFNAETPATTDASLEGGDPYPYPFPRKSHFEKGTGGEGIDLFPFSSQLINVRSEFKQAISGILNTNFWKIRDHADLRTNTIALYREVERLSHDLGLFYPSHFVESLNRLLLAYDSTTGGVTGTYLEPLSFPVYNVGDEGLKYQFSISTFVEAKRYKVQILEKMRKIFVWGISSNIYLSLTYPFRKEIGWGSLWIDNLKLSGLSRNIHVWIQGRGEPLQAGRRHNVLVEITKKDEDAISLSGPQFIYPLQIVARCAKPLEIDQQFEKEVLLPWNGDSTLKSFFIYARDPGTYELVIRIYYYGYLLKSLLVILKIAARPRFFRKHAKQTNVLEYGSRAGEMLPSILLFSTDIGFDSIIQLERHLHGD